MIARPQALNTRNIYFWATHAGAELDLFIVIGRKRYGLERLNMQMPLAGAARGIWVF